MAVARTYDLYYHRDRHDFESIHLWLGVGEW